MQLNILYCTLLILSLLGFCYINLQLSRIILQKHFLIIFQKPNSFDASFIYSRTQLVSLIKDIGIPPLACQDLLSDIFGKKSSTVIEEAPVDSSSVTKFGAHLENYKQAWLNREKLYGCSSQASFFDLFCLNHADVFHHTTLKCLKTDVGLGDPPDINYSQKLPMKSLMLL